MVDTQPGPAYRRLADDLRAQIANGQLPVDSAIPSASQLVKKYEVSTTVVRDALKLLRDEGLVYGQPGKGVYVRSTPEESERERLELRTVADGLEEVREQLAGLEPTTHRQDVDALRNELAELRRAVATLQAQLIELYGRVGQQYPRDRAPIEGDRPPRQERKAAGQ